jgi:hypothetical protein
MSSERFVGIVRFNREVKIGGHRIRLHS